MGMDVKGGKGGSKRPFYGCRTCNKAGRVKHVCDKKYLHA